MQAKTLKAFTLAIVLLISLDSIGLAKTPNNATSTRSLVLESGAVKDGRKTLQSLEKKFERVNGYVFASNLTTYKKGKKIKQSGKFYFKSPNLIRFEVLKGGRKSGSIVVRQPDGKIKGKAGGLLGRFIVSLSPNSNLLKSANGFNILKSDIETLLENAIKQLSTGRRCIASSKPLKLASKKKATVIELLNKAKAVEQRIIVDSKSNLPIKWILFRNSRVFSETTFSFIKFNSKISNELFFLDKTNFLANAKALKVPGSQLTSADQNQEHIELTEELIASTKKSVREARKLSSLLGREANKIQQGNLNNGNEVSLEKRKTLIIVATSIELKLDKLENMRKALINLDDDSNAEKSLSKKWITFTDNIGNYLGRIVDRLDNDVIDLENISRNSLQIEQQTRRLDNILFSAKSFL